MIAPRGSRCIALAAIALLALRARANDDYARMKAKSGPQTFTVFPIHAGWWIHDFGCHSLSFSPARPGANISPLSNDPRTPTSAGQFFSINPSCWGAISNNVVGFKFTLQSLSLRDLGVWDFTCDSIQVQGACVFNGCIPICDPGDIFQNAEPLHVHVTVYDEPPNIHGVSHAPDPVAWNSRVTLGADVDPGDAPLYFHWTTLQAPPATTAAISSPTAAAPVLQLGSAKDIGHWAFQLDADDSLGERRTSTHAFDVPNVAPSFSISGATTINAKESIALSVTPATDPFGKNLSVRWDIVASPPASTHKPANGVATGASLSPIVTDQHDVGAWTFRATATNHSEQGAPPPLSDTKTVNVTVLNLPPTIDLSGSRTRLTVGDTLHLETLVVQDPFGQPLAFTWDLVQVPQSAGILPVHGFSTGPSVDLGQTTLAMAGTWIFTLTVTDQRGPNANPPGVASQAVSVLVAAPPLAKLTANAALTGVIGGDPVAVSTGAFPLTLDASASVDPDAPCPAQPNRCHLTLDGAPVRLLTGGLQGYEFRLVEASPDFQEQHGLGRVDEVFGVDGSKATVEFLSAVQLPPGWYRFQVQVWDSERETDAADLRMQVLDPNTPPTAIIGRLPRGSVGPTGLLADLVISGADSFDLDNLLKGGTPGPGVGISEYRWSFEAPPGCTPPAPPPTTAATFVLYSAGAAVPRECQGAWTIHLTVADDDTPQLTTSTQASLIIGNCPDPVCIDAPSTALPALADLGQSDAVIRYHLDSGLSANPSFASGSFTKLELFHESDPVHPAFTALDANTIEDASGEMYFYWNGLFADGNRAPGGAYDVAITLLDPSLSPTPYTARQPRALIIDSVRLDWLADSDAFVALSALASASAALHFHYQMDNVSRVEQLAYVIRDAASKPVAQAPVPVAASGVIAWDGKTAAGLVLAGTYSIELEARRGGATIGHGPARRFAVAQALASAPGLSDAQLAKGLFVAGSSAPPQVDAGSFPWLRYRMAPLQISVVPSLSGASVTLDFQSGTAANLELYLSDGTPVSLPKTWQPADFKDDKLAVSLLTYGKSPGSVQLKLSMAAGSAAVDSASVRLRVDRFPGATGIALPAYPFHRVLRTANAGATVKIALDPSRHAERVGATAAVYVVAHKTPAQWAADPTLSDVTGGAVPAPIKTGSINDNLTTTRPLPAPGDYDVVYDFGGNGKLDPGDILDNGDASGAPSITVEKSMTALGPMPLAPPAFYGTGAAPATTTIPAGFDGIPAPYDFRLRGQVIYPSSLAPSNPLVVFLHGNHPPLQLPAGPGGALTTVSPLITTDENFKGYTYLQNQLASRGFVTASIDLDESYGPGVYGKVPPPGIQVRAWIGLKNVELVLTDATVAGGALVGKIDPTRIILVGHSRGAEAVIVAYDQLANPASRPPGWTLNPAVTAAGIRGIVSLSPLTRRIHDAPATTQPDVPYLLLFGSADGDVNGATLGAQPFQHYDRARGDKFAVRIEGADHNHFNTSWAYDDATTLVSGSVFAPTLTPLAPPVGPALVPEARQRTVATAYLNAFAAAISGDAPARAYLTEQPSLLRPAGVDAAESLHGQSRLVQPAPVVIDDCESNPATDLSSSGQPVSSTVPSLSENLLDHFSDPVAAFFNQQTRGALFSWAGPAEYVETLPPAARNLADARAICLRAAQQPPAGGAPISFALELQDAQGNKSAIDLSTLGSLEAIYPAQLLGTDLTSAAFKTFCLPPSAFTADGKSIDLSQAALLRLKLAAPGSRIAIDDIEVRP